MEDKNFKDLHFDDEKLIPDYGEVVENDTETVAAQSDDLSDEEVFADDPVESLFDTVPSGNSEMETVEEAINDSGIPSKRGAAFLAGIVGVFGLCVLFAWLVGRHGDGFGNIPSPVAQTVKSIKSVKSPFQSTDEFVSHLALVAMPASTKTPAAKAAASAKPDASASISDRIEKEALEVIHGDYGNNPGRANRLGADYDAVQQRVNQILHK